VVVEAVAPAFTFPFLNPALYSILSRFMVVPVKCYCVINCNVTDVAVTV